MSSFHRSRSLAARHALRGLGLLLVAMALGCDASKDSDLEALSAGDPSASVDGHGAGPLPNAGTPSLSSPLEGGSSSAESTDGDEAGRDASGSSAPPVATTPGEPSAPGSQPQAGTLTAGAWDDNRNYERFSSYRAGLAQTLGAGSGSLPFDDADYQAAYDSAGDAAHATLDIALVIDTTGSMGDEIRYLQSEFDALSSAIEAAYPNAQQRWSLVAYRDQGDDYVTRKFDFATDLSRFRSDLAAQSADGGGDIPEAPQAAFVELNNLSWRADEATAKLAFWVADAPHHAQDAQKFASAVRATQALGVHVYPVASSGVDDLTELTMRSISQLTHGRYLFLTNDSGVGGDHKEPSIPCYFVTRLDDAILRMVDIELSGAYREPESEEIIRKAGDLQDGACTLASGDTVQAF